MNTIQSYRLTNKNGLVVEFLNLGGAITGILVPMKNAVRNVVLAYDTIEDYVTNDYYLGAIVGPIAGRVEKGELMIDDTVYSLTVNTPLGNHIHGGDDNYSRIFWDVQLIDDQNAILKHRHLMGTDGYNSTIDMTVTYHLSNEDEFTISYEYMSNAKTYVNPTNHTYFNLQGEGNVLGHWLQLDAKALELKTNFIPSGRYVGSNVFDFFSGEIVGEKLKQTSAQLDIAGGIDHPFIFNNQRQLICSVDDLKMIVTTSAPAVVIYSGNSLADESNRFNKHQGICFETQDAPNAISLGLEHTLTEQDRLYQSFTSFKFCKIN